MGFLDRTFELEQRGTTPARELLAGVTTFMALSYIVFVQPAVMGTAGVPQGGVLVATCVASAIACVLMGLLANYPIALAPAMGHNFFFTYTVCLGAFAFSWQQGLAAVFVGGCVFLVLSLFGFRARIMDAIPDNLKRAIAAGIGLLITLIGLEYAGIVVYNEGTLLKFGDIQSKYTLLAVFGLGVTLVLLALKVRGAILYGIIITTVCGCLLTVVGVRLFDLKNLKSLKDLDPGATIFKLDFRGLFNKEGFMTVILTFLFLDVFDTVGTLVGVSERAGLLRDGKLPRARWALFSDAAGPCCGGLDDAGQHREVGLGGSHGDAAGLLDARRDAIHRQHYGRYCCGFHRIQCAEAGYGPLA